MTPFAFVPTGEVRRPKFNEHYATETGEIRRALGSEVSAHPIYTRTDAMELACESAFAKLWLACFDELAGAKHHDYYELRIRFLGGERSAAWLAEAKELTSRMKDAADGK